jgi:hypothetical protein
MLNDEGRKIVKEKGPDGNEQNATHLYNINEGKEKKASIKIIQ